MHYPNKLFPGICFNIPTDKFEKSSPIDNYRLWANVFHDSYQFSVLGLLLPLKLHTQESGETSIHNWTKKVTSTIEPLRKLADVWMSWPVQELTKSILTETTNVLICITSQNFHSSMHTHHCNCSSSPSCLLFSSSSSSITIKIYSILCLALFVLPVLMYLILTTALWGKF